MRLVDCLISKKSRKIGKILNKKKNAKIDGPLSLSLGQLTFKEQRI